MLTVNNFVNGEGSLAITYALRSFGAKAARGEDDYINRVLNLTVCEKEFHELKDRVKVLKTTDRFKDVIKTFKVPQGETPAGFRPEARLVEEGVLEVDLVRDIAFDKNGVKRPTGTIFSADSADPYEVAPIAPLLGNLTCNPAIIYDLFINNPVANVGNKFKTREEVMKEIGRVLGPGCDISVELNDPFEKDFDKILKECELFKEILGEYRLVVKVPHTGPINRKNKKQLMTGDKTLATRFNQASTVDAFAGHNLAYRLREHGYRVNFTLMFEPYQSALALQAKPYFINTFLRHRLKQTKEMQKLIQMFELTNNVDYLKQLKAFMLKNDYLSSNDCNMELFDCLEMAKLTIDYRRLNDSEGSDGLDGARHNLRLLRNCNLKDTKLIICSMEGEMNYRDIDNLLTDPEYQDVVDRLVITAEPNYLGRFTSTNQVVQYQRRFLNAVNNDPKKGK